MPVKKGTTVKSGTTGTSGTRKKAEKPELHKFLNEIEKRAYEIYLERKKNGISGDEMSDWLKAENEIKVKYGI